MTAGRLTMRGAARHLAAAVLLTIVAGGARPSTPDDPPTDWIDPDTGHRVIRLSSGRIVEEIRNPCRASADSLSW